MLSYHMELTESQVHRQMLRIREGIFDNYVIVDDDSEAYTGELKPEIKAIIHGSIITDKVLSEEDFKKLFAGTAKKMMDWILSNVDGVDTPVVQIFCVDLLEQTLSRVYSVEEVDSHPSDDFMYG
ncbi:MAG: hypothetical protein ACR2M9_04275 [Cyanophyceae cyanobacterium]